MKLKKSEISSIVAFVCNMVLAYIAYAICRIAYLLVNYSTFSEGLGALSWPTVLKGCWMFDTSAILYTNLLFALLMLLPCHFKERPAWQTFAKWVFVVVNSLAIIVNLADAVYFQYTGRRTTASVFQEFSHEDNLSGIFGVEILNHWYLVVLGILLIVSLIYLYVKPQGVFQLFNRKQYIRYYAIQTVCFLVFIPLAIFGMRGGATHAVRPITISNANQYVNRPTEAALVLNTPFSMIRTIGKHVFKDPQYFSREEMEQIYTPVIQPSDTLPMQQKNVVVLILESFSREFMAAYNDIWNDPTYKGYAPFMDSLLQRSLTFDYTFANGRKSIDGMPSILSSIPHFIEPFFLTPASLNQVSGIAGELGKKGYYSAFFHGAENGSMGFEAFAKTTGYDDYFGRTEYNQDKRFHGDDDFDGMWAIWDEEFLQFYALQMTDMPQPFVTSVFTASSHHPFAVPERYRDVYTDEPGDDNVLHKCIRYVDEALRKFFETAQQQPWYENTLFVITADHTNLSSRPEYQTDLGVFGAPIIFFDPSGEIVPERRHCIAQQIDIMPTVLGYLHYDEPYVAFGTDLLHTPDAETWAVNHTNGIYQYLKGDYLMQFTEDGQVKALYDFKHDWFLRQNLKGQLGAVEAEMQQKLKAIIQQYMQRMTEDRLVYQSTK